MPLWLLGALGWLRNAAAGLLAVSARYPWQTACIALLCLSAWCWHGWDGADAKLKDCRDGRKADQAEWNQKVAAAKAATAKAEQSGKEASHDAEAYHSQLQAARGELSDYIADHRVRPTRPATPAAPGSRDDPAVPASAPAVPAVAVPESVLNTCDADYTYAAASYQFGQQLIERGLAKPAP